jgi:hypothetical protein
LSDSAGIQSGLHIGVIVQRLDNCDDIGVLQKDEAAIAVVISECSKSFWTHCDLRMDFED